MRRAVIPHQVSVGEEAGIAGGVFAWFSKLFGGGDWDFTLEGTHRQQHGLERRAVGKTFGTVANRE